LTATRIRWKRGFRCEVEHSHANGPPTERPAICRAARQGRCGGSCGMLLAFRAACIRPSLGWASRPAYCSADRRQRRIESFITTVPTLQLQRAVRRTAAPTPEHRQLPREPLRFEDHAQSRLPGTSGDRARPAPCRARHGQPQSLRLLQRPRPRSRIPWQGRYKRRRPGDGSRGRCARRLRQRGSVGGDRSMGWSTIRGAGTSEALPRHFPTPCVRRFATSNAGP
jgi:hypothetical protein